MPLKGGKSYGTKRQEMAKNAERLGKMKNCHYSKHEVERLIQLFRKFTKGLPTNKRGNIGLDRIKFTDILHEYFGMTEQVMNEKVFKAFDIDNDGVINQDEWVLGMSVFLRGTVPEQAGWFMQAEKTVNIFPEKTCCYCSRIQLYKQQSHEEDADDGPKELVEMTLKKMDLDHDGRLSEEDYVKAVQLEELLIEALGPCLPNKKCKDFFLELVADEKPKSRLSGKN